MRLFTLLVLSAALAGCSFTPPKPPECEGVYRPINMEQRKQGATAMTEAESLALCAATGGSHV